MTTPEPRVRVRLIGTTGMYWCPGCHEVQARWTHNGTHDDARTHAAACPALRLARLLRELEALRDKLGNYADRNLQAAERRRGDHDYGSYLGGLCNANRGAAADLAALIDRATDGAA